MISLTWEDVDFGTGFLTVGDTKNSETRQIPTSERLTRTLKNVKRLSGYVFCKENCHNFHHSGEEESRAGFCQKEFIDDKHYVRL